VRNRVPDQPERAEGHQVDNPAAGTGDRQSRNVDPVIGVRIRLEHCGLAVNPCRGIKHLPENNARVRFLTETER
jgi:hypothetical protein